MACLPSTLLHMLTQMHASRCVCLACYRNVMACIPSTLLHMLTQMHASLCVCLACDLFLLTQHPALHADSNACITLRLPCMLLQHGGMPTHLCHAIRLPVYAYASMSRYTSACLRLRIYVTLCLPCMLSQHGGMLTHLCHAIRLPVYAYASMSLYVCLACYRSVIACLHIYVTLYVCLSTLTHLCHSAFALHAIAA
jgi:hypothetical protein